MKKRLLFFASLCAFFSFNLSAQQTAFSVGWETIGTSAATYAIQKTTVGSVVGTGLETSGGVVNGILGTLTLTTFNSNTNAAAVNDLSATAPGQAWGRYVAIATAPNFSGIASYNAGEYIEHSVAPTGGQFLRISDISMVALGGGTGNVRMVVMYAVKADGAAPVDADFVKMPAVANYFDIAGSPVTFAADPATPGSEIIIVASNATANTQAKRTITWTGMKINIASNEKAYFRFYPYLTATTASARYLFLRNTVISGLTAPISLPLNFTAFTAKADAFGKSVNLNWKTANEVNTKNFEIERRTDQTSFASIGSVESKNTPGIHSYEFIDRSPVQGTAYYRIKQIDNDGQFSYSDLKDVNVKPSLTLKLYPNPAANQLNVDHGYSEKGGSLKVTGLDGKSYLQQATVSGASSTPLNISSLSPGTYFLIYQFGDQKVAQRFIKN